MVSSDLRRGRVHCGKTTASPRPPSCLPHTVTLAGLSSGGRRDGGVRTCFSTKERTSVTLTTAPPTVKAECSVTMCACHIHVMCMLSDNLLLRYLIAIVSSLPSPPLPSPPLPSPPLPSPSAHPPQTPPPQWSSSQLSQGRCTVLSNDATSASPTTSPTSATPISPSSSRSSKPTQEWSRASISPKEAASR